MKNDEGYRASDPGDREGSVVGDRRAADGKIARRPYSSPRLVVYGDVRELTLGGSPGIGDSAAPGIFKP